MVGQNYQYFPNYPNYQQQYQQPMMVQQPVINQSPQNQILAWVQTEKEAEDFPLATGQSIFLMCQREPYLYMKSVDQLGKTTFIKKRLVDESDNQEQKPDLKEYIRREELEDLITDKIQKEVEKRVSQISFKPTRKKTVVVDDEEE
jgi:hypothetical protein